MRSILLFCVFVGCWGCQPPAPSGIDQIAAGDTLYQVYCAHCHELDVGIGPRITTDVLATRMTATALNRYNRINMPYEAGNTLAPAEYWAITAYLVYRHGFNPSEQFLSDSSTLALVTLRGD